MWVSRWRSVIGRLGGLSLGLPSASKPSSTCAAESSETTSLIGLSRLSLPCSTSCMAAVEVTALVIEAIQNIVSGVIAVPVVRLRLPKAPS